MDRGLGGREGGREEVKEEGGGREGGGKDVNIIDQSFPRLNLNNQIFIVKYFLSPHQPSIFRFFSYTSLFSPIFLFLSFSHFSFNFSKFIIINNYKLKLII